MAIQKLREINVFFKDGTEQENRTKGDLISDVTDNRDLEFTDEDLNKYVVPVGNVYAFGTNKLNDDEYFAHFAKSNDDHDIGFTINKADTIFHSNDSQELYVFKSNVKVGTKDGEVEVDVEEINDLLTAKALYTFTLGHF